MGYINSIETMGLVDGPGIRVVVFLQGCRLRCMYCHNPETWNLKEGKEISPEEIVKIIGRYKNYFGNDGGATFSGGEPLLQPEFLIETMKLCHKAGIHTCLDTAGVGTEKVKEVLENTDLVILDVKSFDEKQYKEITGTSIDNFTEFLNVCQKLEKPLWLRTVMVPGINDTVESVLQLKEYISKIKNVEKVELVPYHTYGKEKYDKLNIPYRLNNVKAMDLDKMDELSRILNG